MAVLVTACAPAAAPDPSVARHSLGPAVERDGAVYTPMSVGPKGCILYNMSIPGGEAVTAMVYQDTEGRFSLGRPKRCVQPRRTP